jgi:hypothetical protein
MNLRTFASIMYWCEGSKSSVNKRGWKQYRVEFSNTDERLLLSFIKCLRSFRIDENRLRVRLFLYDSVDEMEVKKFWSNRLEIPIIQFTKPIYRKAPEKIKHPNGIVNIRYNSRSLYEKIQAEILKFQKKIGVAGVGFEPTTSGFPTEVMSPTSKLGFRRTSPSCSTPL